MMNLLKSMVFAVFDIPGLKDCADIFKLRADQVKETIQATKTQEK